MGDVTEKRRRSVIYRLLTLLLVNILVNRNNFIRHILKMVSHDFLTIFALGQSHRSCLEFSNFVRQEHKD